jgi:hypothetical protein
MTRTSILLFSILIFSPWAQSQEKSMTEIVNEYYTKNCMMCGGTGKMVIGSGRDSHSFCKGRGCVKCDWKGYIIVNVQRICKGCGGTGKGSELKKNMKIAVSNDLKTAKLLPTNCIINDINDNLVKGKSDKYYVTNNRRLLNERKEILGYLEYDQYAGSNVLDFKTRELIFEKNAKYLYRDVSENEMIGSVDVDRYSKKIYNSNKTDYLKLISDFSGCYAVALGIIAEGAMTISNSQRTNTSASISNESKISQTPTQPRKIEVPPVVNASLPTNLKSGLSAFYDFNMNSNDESSYGNHSSLLGPTYATDRFGNPKQALKFDGISNWLTIPNSFPLNSPNVSIGIWFKLENPHDYYKNYCLLQKMASNGQPINLSYSMFILNTNTLVGAYGTGLCDQISGDQFMGLSNSIKNNQWNLFVETISSSGEVRIYINGHLNNVFQGSQYIPCSSDDTHIRIGKGWNGDPRWFKGLMDDIGIWSRVLNEEEILQLYNHKK